MEIHIEFALVVVGICLGAAQPVEDTINADITDLSYLCRGRSESELVPHPFDCNGYFACTSMPTLYYCERGLIFDEVNLRCEVPEKAKCSAQVATATNKPSGSLDVNIETWEQKPQPIFVAVDVVTGLAVNPMEKYDPEHIECRHFGAYFLPHPSNCQLYFICAYGHLHHHQCGQGTYWNYKSTECQLGDSAVCYNHGKNDTNSPPLLQAMPSTTPVSQVTVCYIVSTLSTLSTSERVPTTKPTITLPPRAPTNTLTCPSDRQSYLPHPTDCSKYYICIAGMPVQTSCPKGLFWDQKMGYCDQAKNVKCFQRN